MRFAPQTIPAPGAGRSWVGAASARWDDCPVLEPKYLSVQLRVRRRRSLREKP